METFVKKLVSSLSKEELRHLKITAQKYDTDANSRKDFQLIDYIIKKGEKYNDDEIAERLYKSSDKNSFYRLKNRVNTTVEKSLLEMYYDKDPNNQTLSFIQLYRHFYQKNNLNVAVRYLENAEKEASKIAANDLLEIIYSEFIKLSYDQNLNPEEYIEKRKVCREKMLQVQQIDDVLALLKYRIRVTQNMGQKNSQVGDLLERTLKQVTGKTTADNPDLYFKIYESVSRILLSNNDFERLETYLLVTYEECVKLHLFTKHNHRIKLQMLTYLANTLHKLKKHKQSLEYTQILKDALDEFDGQQRPAFVFYYYNSMANNYAGISKPKAIEYIHQALADKDIARNDLYSLYMYLNLSVQQFDMREFKNSLKSIQKIYINPQFNAFDSGFRYKIYIIECLNRFELRDYDVLEKNLKNLKKKFSTEYTDIQFANQRTIIDLIAAVTKRSSSSKTIDLRAMASQTLQQLDLTATDGDLINCAEWLKTTFKL